MKGIREFYDKTVADWADKWYADDSQLPLLRRFMEFLPEEPRVLDLCCGAGYESMRMSKLGADVVGIDLSPESIAIAKQRNPDLEFHTGDMLEDYSFIGPVDGIMCIAGLVHIPADKASKAIEQMCRVLKPGGYVLLVVREGEGKLEKQSMHVIDGEEYDRAFYGYTREALKQSAAGMLEFVEEIPEKEPSVWHNYIFKKA